MKSDSMDSILESMPDDLQHIPEASPKRSAVAGLISKQEQGVYELSDERWLVFTLHAMFLTYFFALCSPSGSLVEFVQLFALSLGAAIVGKLSYVNLQNNFSTTLRLRISIVPALMLSMYLSFIALADFPIERLMSFFLYLQCASLLSLGWQRFFLLFHVQAFISFAFCLISFHIFSEQEITTVARKSYAAILVSGQAFFVLLYLQLHTKEKEGAGSGHSFFRIIALSAFLSALLAPCTWFCIEVNQPQELDSSPVESLSEDPYAWLKALAVIAIIAFVYYRLRPEKSQQEAIQSELELDPIGALIADCTQWREGKMPLKNQRIIKLYVDFLELAKVKGSPLLNGKSPGRHMKGFLKKHPDLQSAGDDLLQEFRKARYSCEESADSDFEHAQQAYDMICRQLSSVI